MVLRGLNSKEDGAYKEKCLTRLLQGNFRIQRDAYIV